MTKCEQCGETYGVEDFPQCPHRAKEYTPGTCTTCGEVGHPWWDHGSVKNFGEEPLEAYIDEHLCKDQREDGSITGHEITTRGQRQKIMRENNIEYRPKLPRPGAVMYFDQKGR